MISNTATLMPGAYISPAVIIENEAYIGPNAAILGEEGQAAAIICAGAYIGANATILPGVVIGAKARVAPGAVVTRSVPPLAIVEGNPACITGYVETSGSVQLTNSHVQTTMIQPGVEQTAVAGVKLHRFRMVPDLRGSLSVGEFQREIPFIPNRYFLVFDVPTAETRGEHAHFQCEQFLIAVKGSVSVVADDGCSRGEFILNQPYLGLYLPPMTWGIQYRYSSDAVLLVFASHYYDSEDYIRDYAVFQQLVEQRRV